jgi:Mg2+/citrate symporter
LFQGNELFNKAKKSRLFLIGSRGTQKKEISEVEKMREKTRKMRKKCAWIVNLLNVVVLAFLVAKNYNPIFGAVACIIALMTTLVAIMPEMLKGELTITDTML